MYHPAFFCSGIVGDLPVFMGRDGQSREQSLSCTGAQFLTQRFAISARWEKEKNCLISLDRVIVFSAVIMKDVQVKPHPHQALLAGLTVLLVEDEPDIAELFTFILEDYGAEVVLSNSAIEALARLGERRPDILVSKSVFFRKPDIG
jgi:hypothetical protein